ncbi:MAG: histidine phosphatase family protein [Paramuribaculum sp.]|nr:histidine phosphatase family protein [Paramuribaculum sp.]
MIHLSRLLSVLFLSASFFAYGANNLTSYDWNDCRGSAKPYPAPATVTNTPDSLTAVMINHVGRHGARYPSSSKNSMHLAELLEKASKLHTITPRGKRLMALNEKIIDASTGRWGVLDTLGKAEQQGIAMRTYGQFIRLFRDGRINAVSSYVPRCIMSMYEFTHQIARLDNRVEILTSSGRQNNELMRFFSINEPYKAFAESEEVTDAIDAYADSVMPRTVLRKLLGTSFPYEEIDEREALMAVYSVIAGTAAMEMPEKPSDFLTLEEFNALWSVFNLKQYLTHSGNSLSMLPARIARPLLMDLIATTDSMVAGADIAPVQLRFGHAETLMPLLSLIQLPGCSYYSDNLESVATNWLDFNIVPMASNFRLVLFKTKKGAYYVRADFNEIPVALIPSRPDDIYIPWEEAREYLLFRAG